MRQTMVYDRESGEVVTKAERQRRQAERATLAGHADKACALPRRVERGSWVYDRESGQLVTRADFYAGKAAERHGSGPMIIGDDLGAGINGLWHPATGRHTDSKSAFRAMTRAAGCEEIGTDAPKPYAPPPLSPVRDDLKRAMAAQGYM